MVQSGRQPATWTAKRRSRAAPVRGVDDFGVEHQAVILAGGVGDDGVGGALAAGHDGRSRGGVGDAVAVAHPDLFAGAGEPGGFGGVGFGGVGFGEEGAGGGDVDIGAAELRKSLQETSAAEQLGDHGLLAVADAEDGDAHGEDFGGGAGEVSLGDAWRGPPERMMPWGA